MGRPLVTTGRMVMMRSIDISEIKEKKKVPRGLPSVGNGSTLLVVDETQLRTRYDQFRAFQKENVGQRKGFCDQRI